MPAPSIEASSEARRRWYKPASSKGVLTPTRLEREETEAAEEPPISGNVSKGGT